MILSRFRSLALGCALLLGASAAGAASQDTPAAAPTPPAGEERVAEAAETAAPQDTAEDKRICRYVKLDASSRRKTKVCRTVEEWRELNNIR